MTNARMSFGGGEGDSALQEAVEFLGYESVEALVADLSSMPDEDAYELVTFLHILLSN